MSARQGWRKPGTSGRRSKWVRPQQH